MTTKQKSKSRAATPKVRKAAPRPFVDAISDAEAEKIVMSVKQAGPLFPREDMDDLERHIAADKFGFERRAGLAAVSMEGKDLLNCIADSTESAEAFADLEYRIGNYLEALRGLVLWMEEAHRRILVSLAYRPDVQQLLDKAEARRAGAAH
ncbi:MAG TPA: hypothetical protein VK629_17575 [Steroidobacteraceae bacterium]|nr:hypothetical protein [Steroidobacteraceae bacterium]